VQLDTAQQLAQHRVSSTVARLVSTASASTTDRPDAENGVGVADVDGEQ
jgi:hypothetical protein